MPKCVVIDTAFDWRGDRRPNIPLPQSIIYEVHVKGFTKLFEAVPENLRGTYAGLGSHTGDRIFENLGVTAVELLAGPRACRRQGITGPQPNELLGLQHDRFFCAARRIQQQRPHGQQVTEFKEMVRSLHAAGIEVILDVVYNHTGRRKSSGPTLCFRGIDNSGQLSVVAGKSAFLHGLHRHRQHGGDIAPAHAANGAG